MRVRGVQRFVGAKDEFAARGAKVTFGSDWQYGVPACQFLVEFEGAILDELGIKATVGAEVDVFEKDPEHRGRNFRSGMAGVNCDDCRARWCLNARGDGDEDNRQESDQ